MFNSKLYNTPFHSKDLTNYKFLITGGAGFIGSNIVEYLLRYNAGHVRVLDNLSNGYFSNISLFTQLSNFEFVLGDIRDIDTCNEVLNDIDFVIHQAALGSVPRSIGNPILSNSVNVTGFLNMLSAANQSLSLKKFVYAASSSTYGDSVVMPKKEGNEGKPLSPYAVTKAVNEMYADVFAKVYGLESIGLRYFNVFGPKQNPNNPYAAVIPLFCKKIIENESPRIFGDGLTSRDFTFVENAVQANIKALFAETEEKHEVFNVACGEQTTLINIIEILNKYTGKKIQPIFEEQRKGDIKHSLADLNKITNVLGYTPKVKFKEGIEIVYDWYVNNSVK